MDYLNEISEQLQFPIERQFHVLKHFVDIDKEYELLMLKYYSNEEINSTRNNFGSSFYKDFSDNPVSLLNSLLDKKIDSIDIDAVTKNIHLSYSFSKNEYIDGIGLDNLVAIEELRPDEVIAIRTKYLGGNKVQSVNTEAKPTWDLHLILAKQSDSYIVITIFLGKYAPPFPDYKNQSKEYYLENKKFWDKHVFIEH